jgi:hypothetical protein
MSASSTDTVRPAEPAAREAAVRERPARAVVVVFRKAAVKRVNAYTDYLLARGAEVTILVADGQGWNGATRFDPRAEVLSLARRENRQVLVAPYLAVVERGPDAVLRGLAKVLPGPAGKLRRVHALIVRKIRKWFFWRTYQVFRSHALRRLALRHVDALRLESADRVVIADVGGVPFGWTLARRRPGLEVTRVLDRSRYSDLEVLQEGPQPERTEPYRQL